MPYLNLKCNEKVNSSQEKDVGTSMATTWAVTSRSFRPSHHSRLSGKRPKGRKACNVTA